MLLTVGMCFSWAHSLRIGSYLVWHSAFGIWHSVVVEGHTGATYPCLSHRERGAIYRMCTLRMRPIRYAERTASTGLEESTSM